jgi:DNA-directed RNA polymerase subunit M/transcription elongation factor TFIIS
VSAEAVRYRCAACGNLTRFDVTVARRSRAFHHYTLGGDLVVEDEQVLTEEVEDVTCRWCGHGEAVERLDGTGPPEQLAASE